jgi:hypothetical protein
MEVAISFRSLAAASHQTSGATVGLHFDHASLVALLDMGLSPNQIARYFSHYFSALTVDVEKAISAVARFHKGGTIMDTK